MSEVSLGYLIEAEKRIAELEKEPQRLTMQLAEIKDLLADRTAENALFRAENERLRQQLFKHSGSE